MIFLTILMLSSMLTAFMSRPIKIVNAKILIKFNDYEAYEHPISIDENTTILQAVSENYYVKLENNTLQCIRDSCNDENSTWLSFTGLGVRMNPTTHLIEQGESYYLIYNTTNVLTDSANDKDDEAIRDLLKL